MRITVLAMAPTKSNATLSDRTSYNEVIGAFWSHDCEALTMADLNLRIQQTMLETTVPGSAYAGFQTAVDDVLNDPAILQTIMKAEQIWYLVMQTKYKHQDTVQAARDRREKEEDQAIWAVEMATEGLTRPLGSQYHDAVTSNLPPRDRREIKSAYEMHTLHEKHRELLCALDPRHPLFLEKRRPPGLITADEASYNLAEWNTANSEQHYVNPWLIMYELQRSTFVGTLPGQTSTKENCDHAEALTKTSAMADVAAFMVIRPRIGTRQHHQFLLHRDTKLQRLTTQIQARTVVTTNPNPTGPQMVVSQFNYNRAAPPHAREQYKRLLKPCIG